MRLLPLLSAAALALGFQASAQSFRPPSVPLVACDPYFSIWSNADRLTDDATRHWTNEPHRLTSMVRVDGRAYRIMGDAPKDVPAMEQISVQVLPTRSIYRFSGAGVIVSLTFTTPALPDDVAVLSRPVTYLTWQVRASDGKPHDVQIYYDAGPELVINDPSQEVRWSRGAVADLAVLRMRSERQSILGRRGDSVRIDWGDLYTAAPANRSLQIIAPAEQTRGQFIGKGSLPTAFDQGMPRPAAAGPVMATVFRLGKVGATTAKRVLIMAYDDLYSIRFFSQDLRPYWRAQGLDAAALLRVSARDYPALAARCEAFDRELMDDLTRVGGPEYATISALAYRQTWAGNKVAADAKGQPLVFPKENNSNGCIATVDLLYPMGPQYLLFSPSMAKGMMVPVLEYAQSPRWKFPFAPHDLGTYPHATGQVYGGGERTEDNQMPVEESGNMLILMAAIAQMDGNAHFANRYWPLLTKWANYLREKGFDPENQLCTDDFAGHMAHNVNLSAKAIVALGAYAKLCDMRGDKAAAASYRGTAQDFAARWVREAKDGDHYRLAFDRPGTWSQKYNLVWDKMLGLNLFPDSVLRTEMDYYKTVQNRYGLPLDSRADYTKSDWIVWSATLTRNRDDFQTLVRPLYASLNDSPSRVPMTDWYNTKTARQVGFKARPVVGGVFIKMLDDPGLWKKWSSRETTKASGWAPFPPIPPVPVTSTVAATSERTPTEWKYTTRAPAQGWQAMDFDDAAWRTGEGGFGTRGTPGSVVRTEWNTSDLWVRREINVPAGVAGRPLYLRIHHDEDAEVYINGVLAVQTFGFTADYELVKVSEAGRKALKPGRNVIAAHVHQTEGGQYLDIGLEVQAR